MAKFKKILSIIAIAAFGMMFLAGCSLFQLNEERYRNQNVMTVGSEVVTLGEVIDFFNSNASSYIQSGYDLQSLWDSLFPFFVQQKMLISEYKAAFKDSDKNTSDLAKKYKNGEYVSDEELNFIRMTVFVSAYESLDTQTLKNLSSDFTFESSDSSNNTGNQSSERQDLIERDDVWSPSKEDVYMDFKSLQKSLAEYNDEQNFESLNYVFKKGDEKLAKKVKELNGKLKKSNSEDPDVTEDDYIKAQNLAVRTFANNIKNNRNNMSVEEYFVYAVEEQILTRISTNYLNVIYKSQCEDAITEADFNLRLNNLTAQAKTTYDQNPLSFASFVTGLQAGSFIYYVPQIYQGEFHYVRSILLPFSDEQSNLLTGAKSLLGDTAQYVSYRADLAKQIVVKDFTNDKNGEDTDIDVKTLFDMAPSFNGTALSGIDKNTFINWTYAYNTDPGMFNPERGYVISKSSDDMTGSNEKFVPEFVAGARQLANNPSQKTNVVVTDYGIHILLYDGEVTADQISFADRFDYGKEKGSASYRFFSAMYSDVKNMITTDMTEDIYAQYKDGKDGKVFNIDNGILKSYTDQLGIKLS